MSCGDDLQTVLAMFGLGMILGAAIMVSVYEVRCRPTMKD